MQDKKFFWKDLSGRGYNSTLTLEDIRRDPDNQTEDSDDDENGDTLLGWAVNAEEGDTWSDNANHYTCIEVKESERETPQGPRPTGEVIDATPTWQQILDTMLLVLRDGNAEGQKGVKEELKRMAHLADSYNAFAKQFPNGFDSWHETHHQITLELDDRKETEGRIGDLYDDQGSGGFMELSAKLTDLFETTYKGVVWGVDREFYDTIEEFIADYQRGTIEVN